MIHKRYKDSRYREFEREFDEQFESETNKTRDLSGQEQQKARRSLCRSCSIFQYPTIICSPWCSGIVFRRPRGRARRLRSRVPHPR